MILLNNTRISKNTIPHGFPGVYLKDDYLTSLAFREEKGNIIFQVRPTLTINSVDAESVLFEFAITSTSKPFINPNNETELIRLCFDFIKTAVAEFNREIKLNKSTLTVNKFYPEPKLTPNLIQAINSAFPNRFESNPDFSVN